jgi:hypothetical protein
MDAFDFFLKKKAKSFKKRQRFPCSGAQVKSAVIEMRKIEIIHFQKNWQKKNKQRYPFSGSMI